MARNYCAFCLLAVAMIVFSVEAKPANNKTNRKNVFTSTTTTTPEPALGVDDSDSDALIELADNGESTCPTWTKKMASKLDMPPENLAKLITGGSNSNLAFEFMVFCVLDGMTMSDRLDMLKSGISFQEQQNLVDAI